MKLYSSILTHHDLTRAIHAPNVPPTVYLHQCDLIARARVRSRGWSVRLGNTASRHYFNPGNGRYSVDHERGAAHYDDWGWWLAALFEIDPDMRAGEYDGRADFHRKTHRMYMKGHNEHS